MVVARLSLVAVWGDAVPAQRPYCRKHARYNLHYEPSADLAVDQKERPSLMSAYGADPGAHLAGIIRTGHVFGNSLEIGATSPTAT